MNKKLNARMTSRNFDQENPLVWAERLVGLFDGECLGIARCNYLFALLITVYY